jgi:hypothetical protein
MSMMPVKNSGASHFGGFLLLAASALFAVIIWIAVQSQRQEPLPTLVWAPKLSDTELIAASPMVLDRLGKGWWWVYGTPTDRERLRNAGAHVAIAMPTPIAQMAGCSMPPLNVQIRS